jgi:nicotinamide mononucleotide transporter PnuC
LGIIVGTGSGTASGGMGSSGRGCFVFGVGSQGESVVLGLGDFELYLLGLCGICAVWALYRWIFTSVLHSYKRPWAISLVIWRKEHKGISITTISGSMHLIIVVGGVLLSIAVGYLFDQYTEAQATYLDALTTVFSVIITFMVIGKKLENWIYWLVIDSIYVYLYWSRGGYLIALLFIVYLVIVVFGFLNWWKEWKVLNSRKPS